MDTVDLVKDPDIIGYIEEELKNNERFFQIESCFLTMFIFPFVRHIERKYGLSLELNIAEKNCILLERLKKCIEEGQEEQGAIVFGFVVESCFSLFPFASN